MASHQDLNQVYGLVNYLHVLLAWVENLKSLHLSSGMKAVALYSNRTLDKKGKTVCTGSRDFSGLDQWQGIK